MLKVDNFAFKPLQHSKSRTFGHIIDFELTSLSGRPGYISGDHQKHQLRGAAACFSGKAGHEEEEEARQ